METTEKKTCKKVSVLTEARIVCDPPGYLGRYHRTEEVRAEAYEDWCKEFNAFVRDHRSQDDVRLSVERVVQEQCSACKAEWEPMVFEEDNDPYEKGKTYCAHCGTEYAV